MTSVVLHFLIYSCSIRIDFALLILSSAVDLLQVKMSFIVPTILFFSVKCSRVLLRQIRIEVSHSQCAYHGLFMSYTSGLYAEMVVFGVNFFELLNYKYLSSMSPFIPQ